MKTTSTTLIWPVIFTAIVIILISAVTPNVIWSMIGIAVGLVGIGFAEHIAIKADKTMEIIIIQSTIDNLIQVAYHSVLSNVELDKLEKQYQSLRKTQLTYMVELDITVPVFTVSPKMIYLQLRRK